ncbi:carboxylesterase/lipase family protein [Pelagerythrobacter sp.]|uniref:carboxylesterase/lipase family protein n=1 Tax=Pelagerythrobacter sp. TaxID=2800702 RepID=UPI0035AF1620
MISGRAAYLLAGLAGLALTACAHVPAVGDARPVVDAPAGGLRGVSEDGVAVFRGIPYAEAPVSDLRWKPPVAKADWDGVRDAGEFGAPCFQPESRPTANNIYAEDFGPMSEDCLSLNVWAPEDAQGAPVFVWIHGGALVGGASNSPIYDGSHLAEQGVIVVSLNYRLGALGFLAHPELSAESREGISGNYGLLDQIEALRWIERNIAAFGGDPGNVTIAGESAGALSVMYLMTSPPAQGLFDKAVMQSSYMVSTPALKEARHGHPSAESIGTWLQDQLDVTGIADLRAMSARELTDRSTAAGYPTWATVDGKVLPRQTVESFDRGEQAKVPLLAGFNSGEIRSLRRLLPPAPATAEEYEAKIRAAYGDSADRYLAAYPSATIDESLLAAGRDALYGWTAQRMGEKHAAAGAPAYLYLFDHGYPAADEAGLHAFHASEIPFMFGTIWETPGNWPQIPRTEGQRALSDAMVGYWASFARTGMPVAEGHPDWPRFGGDEAFMVFDDTPSIARDVLGDRYDLYEETVCRRRAAGDQQWNWNVGVISPPLPPKAPQCR